MEERRDYAVLRFVDQNGWSYMVNDYAKGCSLMEYIKQGIRVEKETVFEWIRQLSKQLEQYYRCGNEDAAYGYVNPYAVIITGDGMLCLLDINEPENEELLKQMKKKKLRMLFVRKERVLSQKTERSDDLYGLAKIMEFTAEKCLDSKAFTRKEERVWKRMLGKCYSSGKNAIKVLKNMQKEIGFLEREMERPRDKVSAKKILLAILAVCIMSAAIIGGTVKKPETKAIAADQDQPEAGVQEGVKEKKETKEVVEQNGDSPYLEMGLIYYVAWEDYVNSLDSLDKEMQETEFSDAYRVVIASLEEGSIQQQEDGLNAEDAVKKILDELEKRAEKIQMKVYLYQYPLLKVSVLEESEKWHRLTKRIGEEMIRRQAWYRWDTNGEKECEVRKYLAESYFKLGENLKAAEQYEQIRKLESNEEELEEIYEKLQLIYEEAQEYEKVWEISREAVEVLPDSERLWMNYLERYCENPEMERELCAEAVKKAIQAVPELAESEAFKQLQGKYKIVIDGENIRVGE